MVKKEKRLLYFFLISHLYCLILGWFNGGEKLGYPGQYFWHFLAWWCTWNSILTIGFVLWRLRRPKTDNYFTQIFSLIVMLSNLLTIIIYGSGLIIWLISGLTTYCGITSKTTKLVPIPSHVINSDSQMFKVIHWWVYSPLWHFIAPVYFIYQFFCYKQINLLKKKLKLTIFFCLIQPALYFYYCWLRSKLGSKEYFEKFKPSARWTLPFLSSKKMVSKFNIGSDYRFIWKIVLVVFWFSLFGLMTYFTLRYYRRIKKFLLGKKEKLARVKTNGVYYNKRVKSD